MHNANRPNLDLELSRLKSFQRDSVEYVFERMYRDTPPARRFLVADEVGLGKTLVARGLVAKALDELWDSVERIDIVYICSNGSIARQNINRINVTEAKDAALPSRITLLPKVVRGLQQRKVNFISLTPQTSFDLRSSMGTYEERGLLYRLLPDEWRSNNKGAKNALQGAKDRDRFHRHLEELSSADLDEGLTRGFREQVAGHPDLAVQFKDLCDRFMDFRGYDRLPEEDRVRQRDLVGTLRLQLATSCLKALEPDLIIMDEFQRFKHLLDGTDPAGSLARDLFTWQNARVLLLSATPYKMYTTADEQSDDHYRDFLQTVEFLHGDSTAGATFKETLEQYRGAIYRIADGNAGDLANHKTQVQEQLRGVMTRTERLAIKADRNGMLTEVRPDLVVRETDIQSYLTATRVAAALEHHDVIEYWKSSPYLLNFMDDYQFKTSFTEALSKKDGRTALLEALRTHPASVLDWNAYERFEEIDPQNARMRSLMSDVQATGAWRFLWLPPLLPYYQLAGAYEHAEPHSVTKRLVFSSWHVVPKAVAALLSYEAERRTGGGSSDAERPNTPDDRKKRQGLLRFARRDGAIANMSLLTLLYPSIVISEILDPVAIAREQGTWPRYEVILEIAERRVLSALEELPAFQNSAGSVDEAWHWAAPILLDLQRYPEEAKRWLGQKDLAEVWSGRGTDAPADDDDEAVDAWTEHVSAAQQFSAATLGRPPADLARVLATLGLGSPAVLALRALSRVSGGAESLSDVYMRNEAGSIAWGFRSLFNQPDVATLVRSLNGAEPYWQRVAEYCATGCLQAVLDEYAHVLLENEGVAHKSADIATRRIAEVVAGVLQLRTANVGVDDIVLDAEGPRITGKKHMRARFGARFGAKQTDEGAGAIRQDDVRAAFNSPFWPFALCSTSVGQEGLDFHLYCHAVVHWNLPSNPVDLEQREGRVHRYKGHAVRKNLVREYRDHALRDEHPDVWENLFFRAVEARPPDASDLVPFWVLPVEGGAKIERHVPALPLSRDEGHLASLRRSLTVYRMAFGQNRQEDLVNWLQAKCPPEKLEQLADELRIDLAPPSTALEQSKPVPMRRAAARNRQGDGVASDQTDGSGRPLDLDAARRLLDAFRQIDERAHAGKLAGYEALLDEYRHMTKTVS